MSEADNIRRWAPDARGTYEVWYTTWNHPKTEQGFWLRFITENPVDGPPRGELWFARFDPTRPERTFGIHKRFAEVESAMSPFALMIGGSRLGHDHSFGELTGDGHDIRWDLRWDASSRVLRQLPEVMYLRDGLGETTVLSPNPRVPLSGTVLVDGEELSFERAIAGQSHVWGKKHAYSWTWGRCADFAGAPDALLEILAVKLQRRGIMLPPMTLVTLDLDGEQHHLNQFRHVTMNRATWQTGRTTFSAWSPTIKIEGELTCTPDQMVNAPYLDPDGTEVFCVNTEIGDAKVVIYRRSGLRWVEHRRLEGKRRAHFEIGGRMRDPVVRRAHVLVP
ncbi:MAG: hypothetical protein H0T89_02080 [Deltaproteobacteria bacterium]|nr:hypothetical protein [Deltaproteobacteria bacterium]MDQ3297999.1 hypothetical protein [Myxococcota bacterium]